MSAADSPRSQMTADLQAAAAEADRNEALAYAALIEGATASVRADFGLAVRRVQGAWCLVASGMPTSLTFNRVVGLGNEQEASRDAVEALDAVYRAAGVSAYAIELSPFARPHDLAGVLRGRGFMPFKQIAVMRRELDVPWHLPPTELEVRSARPEEAGSFASLCCSVFGFARPVPELLESGFADPTRQHWLALHEGHPVAAATTCLYASGAAWIGWVCTLPAFRGRGAQAALARAQAETARAAGVRRMTLEAAIGSPNRPGPSLRNYGRLGWIRIYDRVIYLRRLP